MFVCVKREERTEGLRKKAGKRETDGEKESKKSLRRTYRRAGWQADRQTHSQTDIQTDEPTQKGRQITETERETNYFFFLAFKEASSERCEMG